MQKSRLVVILAGLALISGGCSTKPRNFSATVSTPVPDALAFEKDYRTCETLVKAGHKSNFKGAAATMIAGGAGTIGAGAAAVSLGVGGVNIGTGVVSAGFVAMPLIGVLAGFGMSRAIRGGREKKFKQRMSGCLSEHGYAVDSWVKLDKRDDAAASAVSRIAPVRSAAATDAADSEYIAEEAPPE